MAYCKICSTLIDDGMEYCADCARELKNIDLDEEYLHNFMQNEEDVVLQGDNITKSNEINDMDVLEQIFDNFASDNNESQEFDDGSSLDIESLIQEGNKYTEEILSKNSDADEDKPVYDENGNYLLNSEENNENDETGIDFEQDINGYIDNTSEDELLSLLNSMSSNPDAELSGNNDASQLENTDVETGEEANNIEEQVSNEYESYQNEETVLNEYEAIQDKENINIDFSLYKDSEDEVYDESQDLDAILRAATSDDATDNAAFDALLHSSEENAGELDELLSSLIMKEDEESNDNNLEKDSPDTVMNDSTTDKPLEQEDKIEDGVEDKKKEKKKKEKKEKNRKKVQGDVFQKTVDDTSDDEYSTEDGTVFMPKQKKSILSILFGNVPDKDGGKKADSNEDDSDITDIDDEIGERKLTKKELKAQKKKEKQEQKKALKERKKKEKEEKKKNKKDGIPEVEEVETGHINKVGSAIIFVLAAGLCVGIILLQGNFSYKNQIKRSEKYYDQEQYSLAYREISGVKCKTDEDKLLYNKLRTIMYVQQYVDDSDNFSKICYYDKAANSLLMALHNYSNKLEIAKEYDVSDVYEKMHKEILSKLKKEYGISEKNANYLLDIEDNTEYSKMLKEYTKKLYPEEQN